MEQQSLVLTAKKQLEWKKRELDPPQGDEILIKTIAGAISIGAELPQYDESDISEASPVYPKETGYESYGEIVAIGLNVMSLKVGDKVIASYGHKDYGVVKEEQAISVPETIHYSNALLTILSCDAAKGVFKLNPNKHDKVLVTGMGTMGLLTVYFLKNYMKVMQVDVIEPDPTRDEIAVLFGASNVYGSESDLQSYYDYGIECSARNNAFITLQKAVCSNGEICILSDGNKDEFTLGPEFYEKELRIVGSSDGWDYRKHSEWFFDYVKNTPFISKLFQQVIDRQELIQCFDDLSKHRLNPLKVLVTY